MGMYSSMYEIKVEYSIWEREGNRITHIGDEIITRKMFFQYDKKGQIKEALERMDMLIKLMGLSTHRRTVINKRQISLVVNHKKSVENHMVFYLDKKRNVEWIRLFKTGLDEPTHQVKVNKKNYRKVLKIISDFEFQI